MPRKQKAKESSESVSLPDVAAMKFWDRLKNPPPVLAFAFPEDPDFKPAPLRPLLSLPSVSPDESAVYSLYIALDELISHNVCIWRRVHVKSIDLEVLHHTIQLCFGWEDMHLHQFNILKTCVPSAEEGFRLLSCMRQKSRNSSTRMISVTTGGTRSRLKRKSLLNRRSSIHIVSMATVRTRSKIVAGSIAGRSCSKSLSRPINNANRS